MDDRDNLGAGAEARDVEGVAFDGLLVDRKTAGDVDFALAATETVLAAALLGNSRVGIGLVVFEGDEEPGTDGTTDCCWRFDTERVIGGEVVELQFNVASFQFHYFEFRVACVLIDGESRTCQQAEPVVVGKFQLDIGLAHCLDSRTEKILAVGLDDSVGIGIRRFDFAGSPNLDRCKTGDVFTPDIGSGN